MHDKSAFNRLRLSFRLFRLAGLLIVWTIGGTPVSAGEVLRVHLHGEKISSGGVLRIRDIASVTGADADAIAEIGDVDISIFSPDKAEEVIPRDRITARLILAGYNGREVVVTGANLVQVRRQKEQQDSAPSQVGVVSVEAAARSALAATFNVEPEDIDAKLASPLDVSIDEGDNSVTVDVLPPTNVRPGRVRLPIRVFSKGRLKQVTSGLFDLRLRQRVVLASATLPVGAVLTANSVTFQEKWVTKREDFPQPQALPRWKVRRPIQQGETVTLSDLIPIAPGEEEPVVIEARDVVQLVARGKGINATVPAAEALESGRVGDTIRVRNMHSRRVVVGQIVSAEEVEVRF